jgi:outer membrane biosynthesis protein TonB
VRVGAGCTLALAGAGFIVASVLPAQAAQPDKVWVCKYTGPADNQEFSGLNEVSWNTLTKNREEVVVGAWFGDNHNSYVIQIGGSKPADSACLTGPTPEPTETTPVPTETTPVPTETTPVPTETTPVPTETTPVPTETTPAPTETTPVPTETTPVPTETTPVPTETTKPTKPGGAGDSARDKTPPGGGGLGPAAPKTGGSGEPAAPANALIGAGLLLTALGLMPRNVLTGRKSQSDSAN